MKADVGQGRTRPTLALGTAQWGLDYGIANRSGQPAASEIGSILDTAVRSGIKLLDTASAYGTAERAIGEALAPQERRSFRIVTKVLPAEGADHPREVRRATEDQLDRSTRLLGTRHLDVVLLHHDSLRERAEGAAWKVLQTWQRQGRIGQIGVSAESPAAADRALDDPDVEVLQVATSIADRRIMERGVFDKAAQKGIEVHVRSVFLQGVAFLKSDELPVHLQPLSPALWAISELAASIGVEPPAVWLRFALGLPVRHLVVGVEREEQLRQLLQWSSAAIPPSSLTELTAALPDLTDDVLDPARWP